MPGRPCQRCIRALKDKNTYNRDTAAYALGTMKTDAKAAIPALAELLKDKEPANRCAAARALETMAVETKGVLSALTAALNDEDINVVFYVARTLGQLGPQAKPAAPALRGVIGKDRHPHVRLPAAEALVKIGEYKSEAFAALASLVDEEKSHEAVQALARLAAEVKTNGELKIVLPALESALKDKRSTEQARWGRSGSITNHAKVSIPAAIACGPLQRPGVPLPNWAGRRGGSWRERWRRPARTRRAGPSVEHRPGPR